MFLIALCVLDRETPIGVRPAICDSNDNYTGEGTRTYDAENHLKQAWANNQWQTYTYDADGRMVAGAIPKEQLEARLNAAQTKVASK